MHTTYAIDELVTSVMPYRPALPSRVDFEDDEEGSTSADEGDVKIARNAYSSVSRQ